MKNTWVMVLGIAVVLLLVVIIFISLLGAKTGKKTSDSGITTVKVDDPKTIEAATRIADALNREIDNNIEYKLYTVNGIGLKIPSNWSTAQDRGGMVFKNEFGSFIVAVNAERQDCYKSLADYKDSIVNMGVEVTDSRNIRLSGLDGYLVSGTAEINGETATLHNYALSGSKNIYEVTFVTGPLSAPARDLLDTIVKSISINESQANSVDLCGRI